jgi:hypothetical protein
VQIQEETYLDSSELSSHLAVEGQLQVEAVGIKQPMTHMVETVAPLFTHSDWGNLTGHFPILALIIFFHQRLRPKSYIPLM